jgi:hypothetical protein
MVVGGGIERRTLNFPIGAKQAGAEHLVFPLGRERFGYSGPVIDAAPMNDR